MADIFDNPILCKNCNSRMEKTTVEKNGFLMRAVACDKCGNKILHPNDEQEYSKFTSLRHKEFRVKMRLVGNSYTVSIPKEIASFMREQEKMMDDMVRLCFEDFGKLSLNFSEQIKKQKEEKEETPRPVVEFEQIKKHKEKNGR
ncbi:MAG: hypothetical protein Q8P79_02590 [Nanoarchaeota archaeon]|nr:hypothetical protein [Nanoarchaeota archaeon]